MRGPFNLKTFYFISLILNVMLNLLITTSSNQMPSEGQRHCFIVAMRNLLHLLNVLSICDALYEVDSSEIFSCVLRLLSSIMNEVLRHCDLMMFHAFSIGFNSQLCGGRNIY